MADKLDVEMEGRPVVSKYEGSMRNVVQCTVLACLGALCFGFTIGFSSPAIPSMVKYGVLSLDETGWFGSLMTVGALGGGPLGGWFIEKLGRKRTILLSNLPFVFGYCLMIAASNSHYLYLGRLLTGLASGMITVSVPMYVAEIATKSRRGVLGSCVQLFIVIGISLAYMLGLKLEWREMANAALIPSVLAVLAAFLIPETPRWLLVMNRKLDARQALTALRDPHADVQDELKDIEEGLDAQDTMSWSEFFGRAELTRPLFISVMIMVFQQLSGINVVMFYTVSIFESVIPGQAYVATNIIGFVQVVATLIACLLMDRVGRKKLLLIAGAVMSLTLFTFGMYYKLADKKLLPDSVNNWIPVVCLTVYIIGFSLGWGPIPMLIMSEIFPTRGRGTAGAITVFANWLCAFIITKEFMTLQLILGKDGAFYFFSMCCAAGVWFVYKYLPETKGKSLEDIELYFLGRSIVKV